MTAHRLCTPLIVVLLLVAAGSQALAAAITLDREELEGIFTELQLATSPWPAEDLGISNFASSPSTVSVPMGELDYELINQNPGRFLGKKHLSVIITVDGTPQAKVKMWADIELYGDVVLLNRRVGRNDTIQRGDLSVVRRNITMFSHELVTSPAEATGQALKTSLAAGTILLKKYLKPLPLVERGDLVTIQAGAGSLQISTKGEARGQGAEGETIQVKNLSSRQVVTARVVASGLVRVDL